MQAWKAPEVPVVGGGTNDLEIFDTRVGSLVRPNVEAGASLYVCGITPYDATHMGHAATYVAFDLLNRYWRDAGVPVSYVQNVTDIDDPLLERAEATCMDWVELAEEQTELFRTDMEALNVLPPEHYIGAVESIEWIVPVVEDLIEHGMAYRVDGTEGVPDGDVYFSVKAAESLREWTLGEVSGLSENDMVPVFADHGGDPQRPGKHHPLDALLWRVAREGEPAWHGGSLGEGRPGWHIECSVIARRFLPAPFTLQGGGSDLRYPHHEMSAAHAVAWDHTKLAQHYAHTGMVGLDGEKMSKSKGNLVLVSKLRAEGVEPAAIRTVLLGQHYRSDWFWTAQLLTDATRRLESWRAALPGTTGTEADAVIAAVRARMSRDLDAPGALNELDAWAARTSAAPESGDPAAAARLAGFIDALLGIRI